MWEFANWRSNDDPTERLRQLRLHIAEVSQHVLGTSTRGLSVTPADPQYLARLEASEDQLRKEVTRPSIARNKLRIRD